MLKMPAGETSTAGEGSPVGLSGYAKRPDSEVTPWPSHRVTSPVADPHFLSVVQLVGDGVGGV